MPEGIQFSGLAAYLRRELEAMDPAWAAEFDQALASVQPELEELQKNEGDPNFTLMVLANARWRRLKNAQDGNRGQVLGAIEILLGEGYWQQNLRRIFGPGWSEALREAKTVVPSAPQDLDEGLFDGLGTIAKSLGAHSEANHAMAAAWLLDQHMRSRSKDQRSNLGYLSRVLSRFGLPPVDPEDPGRRVEKWLQLARKSILPQKFFQCIVIYHDVHQWAGLPCGSACKPLSEMLLKMDQEKAELRQAPRLVEVTGPFHITVTPDGIEMRVPLAGPGKAIQQKAVSRGPEKNSRKKRGQAKRRANR